MGRWAVLLLACLAGCATASHGLRSRDVQLREGKAILVVDFDAGHEAWADYLLQRSSEFLVLGEEYLDVSFHQAAREFFGEADPEGEAAKIRRIVVHGGERVELHGDRVGAYNNIAGTFGGDRAIFVEYQLSRRGDPSVILHELGHFWFHDRPRVGKGGALTSGAPWWNEGIVSALALMALALTPAETAALRDHWGVRTMPGGPDPPLSRDFRHDGPAARSLYYSKALKTQLLIADELGPEEYRRLLQAAARKIPATDEETLKLLAARRRIDWRALLTGWVFGGPYTVPPAEAARRF